ncbi:hypothetical protein ACFY36_08020 [Actinoplanes sp. NPDC000266]
MTQPLPPNPTAAPPIPTTVRVAFWFQLAVAAMLLLFVGTAIARAVHYDGLITEAALAPGTDQASVAGERSFNVSDTLFPAIPALILAIWLGITAFLVRRGNNVGRILTFAGIGAPVALFFGGCLLGGMGVLLFAGSLAAGGIDEEDPFDDEPFPDDTDYYSETFPGEAFYDRLSALDSSGWTIAYEVISFSALVLALACAIVTVVLLLVGPSNRFFRPGRPITPRPPLPYGYGVPPAYPASPYPAPPHPGPSFPAPVHPSAAFPGPGYPSSAFPAPSHPGAAFPAPGYPSAAFPAPVYPGSAFPQASVPFPQPPVPFGAPSPYAPPPPAFPAPDQSSAAPGSAPTEPSGRSSAPDADQPGRALDFPPAEPSSPSPAPAADQSSPAPAADQSSPAPASPPADQPTPPSA